MTVLDGSHARAEAIHALVLGGGGFIGSHLVRALAAHTEYSNIEIAGSRAVPTDQGTGWIEGDVDRRMLGACAKPDVVFWAIGGASVGRSLEDPVSDYERSIPPLAAVLERLEGPWKDARLVFLSSAAVYGAGGSAATSVASPLAPVSPYGENKQLSEGMITQSTGGGARHTIVRPFSVYGPGLRRQLFWDALQKAGRNELLFAGTGQELRDWTHVRDLVALLADLGSGARPGPAVLNAGTGTGTRVAEALALLLSFLPQAPVPRFTGISREGDPERLVADADEQRPYAPYFRMPLHEGLAEYHRWFDGFDR